jgi:hypothetical protein
MKIVALLHFGWLAFGATACIAPSRVLQHLPSAMNQHMLPTLEPEVEMGALGGTDSLSPEELLQLFQNEVYRNVAEPTSMHSCGTASLHVTEATVKRTGRALQMMQLATMLTPCLLGVPLETYQTTLTARVQIRDVQGRVLGEYEGRGQARARVALYYGFAQHLAAGVSSSLALRLALAQIRQQLDSEAPCLTPLLVAAQAASAPPSALSLAPATPRPAPRREVPLPEIDRLQTVTAYPPTAGR